MSFTNEERKMLRSKTAKSYIENSIKFKNEIPSGRKAKLCRIWLRHHRLFSIKDIMHERNIHPYWKKIKMKNSLKRNKEYLKKYYTEVNKRKPWSDKKLQLLIRMKDHKRKNSEIALQFKRSLSSVFHKARCYLRAKKDLSIKYPNVKIYHDNYYKLMIKLMRSYSHLHY